MHVLILLAAYVAWRITGSLYFRNVAGCAFDKMFDIQPDRPCPSKKEG